MLPPKLELMPFWMMLNLVTRSHYLCFSLWKMSMSWWVDLFLKQQILKPSALNPFFEARLLETIFCLVQGHKVVCTRPDFFQDDVFELMIWKHDATPGMKLSSTIISWSFPHHGHSLKMEVSIKWYLQIHILVGFSMINHPKSMKFICIFHDFPF